MSTTRRQFLARAGAAGAAIALPAAGRAQGSYDFESKAGAVRVHPVHHAALALETPSGVFYLDPVGDPGRWAGLPPPDTILVTHEHGDHFTVPTLRALTARRTKIVTNARVMAMLPSDLARRARAMANGETARIRRGKLEAVPAYNITPGRRQYHPKGRDNGFVLTTGGTRIYVSGDTEDVPEVRALKGIDVAFLCMVLPYTMDAGHAAGAVRAFRPRYVFPYHYGTGSRGEDPRKFARMVGNASTVELHDWYG